MSSIAKMLMAFPPLFLLLVAVYVYFGSVKLVRTLSGADLANRKPGAVVRTDDLAQSITNKPQLAPLQDWAVGALDRFRARRLYVTGRRCVYYPFSQVQLATNEIAAFILQEWRGEPEVSVVTTTNGRPECIAISWYLHGLFVGPTNYVKTISKQFDASGGIWYLKEARPGIYAYHLYK